MIENNFTVLRNTHRINYWQSGGKKDEAVLERKRVVQKSLKKSTSNKDQPATVISITTRSDRHIVPGPPHGLGGHVKHLLVRLSVLVWGRRAACGVCCRTTLDIKVSGVWRWALRLTWASRFNWALICNKTAAVGLQCPAGVERGEGR